MAPVLAPSTQATIAPPVPSETIDGRTAAPGQTDVSAIPSAAQSGFPEPSTRCMYRSGLPFRVSVHT